MVDWASDIWFRPGFLVLKIDSLWHSLYKDSRRQAPGVSWHTLQRSQRKETSTVPFLGFKAVPRYVKQITTGYYVVNFFSWLQGASCLSLKNELNVCHWIFSANQILKSVWTSTRLFYSTIIMLMLCCPMNKTTKVCISIWTQYSDSMTSNENHWSDGIIDPTLHLWFVLFSNITFPFFLWND